MCAADDGSDASLRLRALEHAADQAGGEPSCLGGPVHEAVPQVAEVLACEHQVTERDALKALDPEVLAEPRQLSRLEVDVRPSGELLVVPVGRQVELIVLSSGAWNDAVEAGDQAAGWRSLVEIGTAEVEGQRAVGTVDLVLRAVPGRRVPT